MSATTSDLPTIHRACLEAVIARLRECGVEITPADEHGIGNGLLSAVRAALVRTEFKRRRKSGEKYRNVIQALSNEYCVGESTVRNIVDAK